MAIMIDKSFKEAEWDHQEFDWQGKSFFFLPFMNLFGKPLGLPNKLEELYREVRQNGYRSVNNQILVQASTFKGRIMMEVEKQDKYDSQVITYDSPTTVETIVHDSSKGSLSGSINSLKQRVTSRKGMEPREIYYWLVTGPGSQKTILFAVI